MFGAGNDHDLAVATQDIGTAFAVVVIAACNDRRCLMAMQFGQDDAELVLDRIGLFVGDRVRRTVAEQAEGGVFQLLAGAHQPRQVLLAELFGETV